MSPETLACLGLRALAATLLLLAIPATIGLWTIIRKGFKR